MTSAFVQKYLGPDAVVTAQQLNRACDDVLAAIDAPDNGVRDVLNLLVNAALVYAADPTATLNDVAARSYDEPLETVLGWCAQ
jgi:hypothetical protein